MLGFLPRFSSDQGTSVKLCDVPGLPGTPGTRNEVRLWRTVGTVDSGAGFLWWFHGGFYGDLMGFPWDFLGISLGIYGIYGI